MTSSYLNESVAREHQYDLLSEAATLRAARRAADRRAARGDRRARRAGGGRSTLGRPFSAVHSWLLAGQL